MKKILTIIFLSILSAAMFAATPQQYIEKAAESLNVDSLTSLECLNHAIEILDFALLEYPENADILAYLGLYTGQKAGQVESYQQKASLAFESFSILDRAVSIDSENVNARYFRGIMGVNVPEFMGKLEQAKNDFEVILQIYNEKPDKVSQDILLNTYVYLTSIYENNEDYEKAVKIYSLIIEDFPDSDEAIEAQESLEKIEIIDDDVEIFNIEEIFTLSTEYIDNEELDKAEQILLIGVELFPDNFKINKRLGIVYSLKAEVEYNEEIKEDTDYRSNLCFQSLKYLDKAVEIDPEDIETRLLRGIMGVGFPFFVNKLDTAIEDLNFVLSWTVVDSIKAECLYYLGLAYQKKSITPWIKIAVDYPESNYAQEIYNTEKPQIENNDFSEYNNSIVVIDFSLGFLDELPPQTAVWIEDETGNFVKTLYVSGFAGFVGNVQITLPKWGNSSDFQTDGTTGASINNGNHQ